MKVFNFLVYSISCVSIWACSDKSAPVFPENAELTVSDITASGAHIGWPKASDDKGVAGYKIECGEKTHELSADTTDFNIEELEELQDHDLVLRALDEAGNLSSSLEASFRTLDGSGPSWPEDAKITVSKKESSDENEVPSYTFTWPHAQDPSGVDKYKIFLKSQEVSDMIVNTNAAPSFTLQAKDADTKSLYVSAYDKAGNASSKLYAFVDAKAKSTAKVGESSSLLIPVDKIHDALKSNEHLGTYSNPKGYKIGNKAEDAIKRTPSGLLQSTPHRTKARPGN